MIDGNRVHVIIFHSRLFSCQHKMLHCGHLEPLKQCIYPQKSSLKPLSKNIFKYFFLTSSYIFIKARLPHVIFTS